MQVVHIVQQEQRLLLRQEQPVELILRLPEFNQCRNRRYKSCNQYTRNISQLLTASLQVHVVIRQQLQLP